VALRGLDVEDGSRAGDQSLNRLYMFFLLILYKEKKRCHPTTALPNGLFF
jgi:hypothetical protein